MKALIINIKTGKIKETTLSPYERKYLENIMYKELINNRNLKIKSIEINNALKQIKKIEILRELEFLKTREFYGDEFAIINLLAFYQSLNLKRDYSDIVTELLSYVYREKIGFFYDDDTNELEYNCYNITKTVVDNAHRTLAKVLAQKGHCRKILYPTQKELKQFDSRVTKKITSINTTFLTKANIYSYWPNIKRRLNFIPYYGHRKAGDYHKEWLQQFEEE